MTRNLRSQSVDAICRRQIGNELGRRFKWQGKNQVSETISPERVVTVHCEISSSHAADSTFEFR